MNQFPFYDKVKQESEVSLLDLKTVEDLAGLSGKKETPEVYLFLLSLFDAAAKGSLCIASKSVQIFFDQMSDSSFCFDPDEMKKLSITGSAETDPYVPIIYFEGESDTYWYFQRYFTAKKSFDSEFQKLIQSSSADTVKSAPVIDEILEARTPEGFFLNEDQKEAVRKVFRNRFTLISGGPGTGKTTVIQTILSCFEAEKKDISRIFLAAPTGRAAQHINEKMKPKGLVEACTIHRLLQISFGNRFFYSRNNPLPAQAVLIDEVSMVDISLMKNLLEAIPDDSKVIFIGDRDQLPSVDSGAVLSHLIESAEEKKELENSIVYLKESQRSKGNIWQSACLINDRILSLEDKMTSLNHFLEPLKNDEFENTLKQIDPVRNAFWLKPEEKAGFREYQKILLQWFRFFYNDSYREKIDELKKNPELLSLVLSYIQSNKILCLNKSGIRGAEWINRFFRQELARILKIDLYRSDTWFSGLPVMMTVNRHKEKLFNGNIGMIIEDRVYFMIEGKAEHFPKDFLLPELNLAFALTVHKSQGSEYGKVFLILPERQTRLLSKEMIYTGLTRAKEQFFLYGEKTVAEIGINCKIERESGPDLGKIE
ncbi:MAG TPA: exodeoxyribonuclease V subunit alpha [Spirochaetia bacterium]|nr:exodeoxyribonuclease V subunit alpha [Spirochaetia bacterium]